MKKLNALNLGKSLNRAEMKVVNGGLAGAGGPDTCNATCKDGTTVSASSCDTSQANLACSERGGSTSCKCGGKGPFDPPGIV